MASATHSATATHQFSWFVSGHRFSNAAKPAELMRLQALRALGHTLIRNRGYTLGG